MIDYLRRHWNGRLPLLQAFWLNFFLLFLAFEMLEPYLWPPYLEGEVAVTVAILLYLLVSKVVVYTWQLVGVLRVCSRRIRAGEGRLGAMVGQTAMAGSLVITIVLALDSGHALQVYRERLAIASLPVPEPSYTLDWLPQAGLIHLRGPLEVGITRRVEEMILDHPGVAGIVLDSDGGQIYEGRGLALLIGRHGLDTYTTKECSSACTTAFVAGARRALGERATLGFHRYRTYSVIPSIDVADEEARDRAIFLRQGVSAAFLDRAFSYPPDDLWRPSVEELLRAGVIHRSGFSLE